MSFIGGIRPRMNSAKYNYVHCMATHCQNCVSSVGVYTILGPQFAIIGEGGWVCACDGKSANLGILISRIYYNILLQSVSCPGEN